MACQQALRVLVRRDFDQRAIEFDAGLTRGAGRFERRDKAVGAAKFVFSQVTERR